LKEFQSQYPNYKFIFSLGTDLIDGISSWNNSTQLLEEFEFIICKRVNYNPSFEKYPQNNRILEGYVDASSTRIRNRIHRNLNQRKKLNLGINGMTTQSVIKYICGNNLYSINDCVCNMA
jgi:nicotinic acid mononucleotide adenylyltransferase